MIAILLSVVIILCLILLLLVETGLWESPPELLRKILLGIIGGVAFFESLELLEYDGVLKGKLGFIPVELRDKEGGIYRALIGKNNKDENGKVWRYVNTNGDKHYYEDKYILKERITFEDDKEGNQIKVITITEDHYDPCEQIIKIKKIYPDGKKTTENIINDCDDY